MSDLDPIRNSTASIWIVSGLAALAMHAGFVAVGLAYMQPEDVEDAVGAPAIEIGVELAAPRTTPTELPPGPEVEASAAAPSVVEQKTVVEQSDLPKDTPTETDDPDRLVAIDDTKKPKEDDPTVQAVQAAPSEESVASEATAMPSMEAIPEAPRSVAPAQGTGESARRVRMTWQKELVVHLDKYKRYPADRPARSVQIVVNFELDRMGHVLSKSILKGSGDAAFDQAALAMMQRADPVPAPPPLVADEGLTFSMPVIFRVKGRN